MLLVLYTSNIPGERGRRKRGLGPGHKPNLPSSHPPFPSYFRQKKGVKSRTLGRGFFDTRYCFTFLFLKKKLRGGDGGGVEGGCI